MPCSSPRNLDISALRSFVTVAELGGVTRAADKGLDMTSGEHHGTRYRRRLYRENPQQV